MTVASEAEGRHPVEPHADLVPLLARRPRPPAPCATARARPSPARSAKAARSTARRSSASSTRRMGLPGSRPTPRRSTRSRAMPARMSDEGRFGEMEALLAQIGAAEYAAQLSWRRGDEPGRDRAARTSLAFPRRTRRRFSPAMCATLIASTTPATRARAIALIRGLARRRRLWRYRPRRDVSKPCARRCTASRKPRSFRMRRTGTSRTNTCRWS